MDESNNLPSENIPEELHSEYEERPFRNCTRCGETLLDYENGYHVAKIFKSSETIFEYALCFSCHAGLISEFSEDSKRSLGEYYSERMKLGLGLFGCGLCGLPKIEFIESSNREHYVRSPYSYEYRIGRKYCPPLHVDLGQGLVQLLNEVQKKIQKA